MYVAPSKVYIMKLPTQVRFNCSVNAFPEGNIVWMHNYVNLKASINQAAKKLRRIVSNVSLPQSIRNKKEKKIDSVEQLEVDEQLEMTLEINLLLICN